MPLTALRLPTHFPFTAQRCGPRAAPLPKSVLRNSPKIRALPQPPRRQFPCTQFPKMRELSILPTSKNSSARVVLIGKRKRAVLRNHPFTYLLLARRVSDITFCPSPKLAGLYYLVGVRSDVPLGVWRASVPTAPVLVAPGVRLGDASPGVRSEVLPLVPSLVPLEAELWMHAAVALSHFMSLVLSQSAFVIGTLGASAANAGAVNATARPKTRSDKTLHGASSKTSCCHSDCPARTPRIKLRAGQGSCFLLVTGNAPLHRMVPRDG